MYRVEHRIQEPQEVSFPKVCTEPMKRIAE